MKSKLFLIFLLTIVVCASCTKTKPDFPGEPPFGDFNPPDMPGESGADDSSAPNFDNTIYTYAGQLADDAANDAVGDNEDFYWEANSFKAKNKVTIAYNGSSASVSCENSDIEYHTDGAHVVLDLQTNAVSGVEIELSGKSDDGSLKIYGEKKFKLTLSGVELTSQRGPAINSQCKKRIYVHITGGTTNHLTDCANYEDDVWYFDPSKAADEDRKGAFFSEGNLIFSGTGALVVAGKQKHGIASDGYMFTRPGVTIAVTEAAKNAIHIKGDSGDGIGIRIMGGLIYTNVASDAGKGMKADLNVEILGGRLDLNTSGKAVYEADENDTSSAAGIKTDGNITISGGTISVKATGTGGKGLNADGEISISGGETTITTTGGKYQYNSSLTSSPKGVKADGDIMIEGGKLNIWVSGASDGSEGLESKSVLTINGGEIYIKAYDDAINASEGIIINDGRIWAYSSNNDGIDSNGYLHFNGGLILAAGCTTPEEAFDCDDSSKFLVNGGTLIGLCSTVMNAPSSASGQRVVLYGGIAAAKDEKISILDSSNKPLMTYTVPRSLNGHVLFFSSPDIESGKSYTVSKGGSISGHTDTWNGWYGGGTWSGGSQVGTFTSSSVITTVGSFGAGGNPGGGPGGTPPGGQGGPGGTPPGGF